MKTNCIRGTLAVLCLCSTYSLAVAQRVPVVQSAVPFIYHEHQSQAKSQLKPVRVAFQDDSAQALFGNPFVDDPSPTLAPQPSAAPAAPSDSIPTAPLPMQVNPVPAPVPMGEAAPVVSIPAPVQVAPVLPATVVPANACEPCAAAPSCGLPMPSCGAPAPSCGLAGPTCGLPGPTCGLPGPTCGMAGPSCGLAGPTCGAASGCDGCGSGCGGLGLCDCNLGDAFTLSGLLHGDCPPAITIGGWFSAGYHSKDNGLFNSRPDQFALHQGWLYAEKVASGSSPLGFRVDAMYGIDAGDTQAFGNPPGSWDFDNGFDHDDYGWAIPQAYLEVALTDSISVKAGHFYTLVGYEVVTAPDNFFYSHAMTMYNSEPFTHTGVLATAAMNDNVTLYAGWTLGWDTGFDQLDGGSSWLGGIGLTLTDNATLTYISTAGNFGWRGDDAYSHSVLLDVAVSDSLNYVFQSDLVRVDSTGEDNVGINQYLLYSVSDCLGLGARVEWWKGDVLTGYAPHGGSLPAFGSLSYYAATFGVNYRPHANFIVRPEARIDWSPAADYDESYFGVDAIFTF